MTDYVKHVYFWDRTDATGGKTRGLRDGNEQTTFACVTWGDNGKAYGGGSNGRTYTYGGSDGRTCEGTMKQAPRGLRLPSSTKITNSVKSTLATHRSPRLSSILLLTMLSTGMTVAASFAVNVTEPSAMRTATGPK